MALLDTLLRLAQRFNSDRRREVQQELDTEDRGWRRVGGSQRENTFGFDDDGTDLDWEDRISNW